MHIPKTGGGSFGSLLEQHFKDRLLRDYQDRPFWHDDATRNCAALTSRAEVKDLPGKYDCVHGHFLPTKYDIAEQQNIFITWFRHPCDWALSRYYFGLRTKDPVISNNMSIYEFCEIEKYHNFYGKYLWNFDLDKFRFIGITGDYENSKNVFRNQFRLGNEKAETKNVNPGKIIGSSYEIGADLRNLIYKNNPIDFEIYKKAIEVNEVLKKKYLD